MFLRFKKITGKISIKLLKRTHIMIMKEVEEAREVKGRSIISIF